MNTTEPTGIAVLRPNRPLRVGFLPLTDCAPLVMAHELGYFTQYDLNVELCRERDWTTISHKFVNGELDAIQAPASFPFTISLGINCEPCACVTGLITNLQGNAITLSSQLKDRGVVDAPSLRAEIFRLSRLKTFTFGVPHALSTHGPLLRQWLREGGIDPDWHVRIIAVSPIEMYPHLKLGYLDGYCVGEPWNSVAIESGTGFCVATSADLAPLHPEKVMLVRREFAEQRTDEHLHLLAALIEGCRFCDVPKNWDRIRSQLTHLEYVNAPLECLLTETGVPFNLDSCTIKMFHDFAIFHRHRANAPTRERAQWLLNQLVDHALIPPPDALGRQRLLQTFNNDYFSRALALVAEETCLTASESRRIVGHSRGAN
jgi:ABC-type nitrate/sulfonate/bicarbonate transport system substrate-binding protein